MINKRRAIPLIVVIFLVCIVLALGLYHVFTSFDIKRSEDIVGAINVTTTGSSENIPLATSNNGDFSGIFFQEAEYNKLISPPEPLSQLYLHIGDNYRSNIILQ